MDDVWTVLFFVVVYGLFFFGLSPLLLALPLPMVILFAVMMGGPSFMVTLIFRGYLLQRKRVKG